MLVSRALSRGAAMMATGRRACAALKKARPPKRPRPMGCWRVGYHLQRLSLAGGCICFKNWLACPIIRVMMLDKDSSGNTVIHSI